MFFRQFKNTYYYLFEHICEQTIAIYRYQRVFLLTFDRLPEVHPVLRRQSCFVWRVRASAVDAGASVC